MHGRKALIKFELDNGKPQPAIAFRLERTCCDMLCMSVCLFGAAHWIQNITELRGERVGRKSASQLAETMCKCIQNGCFCLFALRTKLQVWPDWGDVRVT